MSDVDDPQEVRRAGERFHTRAQGRESWYSFSYAEHYDAANTHHGLLLAHNDETLQPGAGYAEHPHRDLEILTWVIAGTLSHRDSIGGARTVSAGEVAVMSTGSGVRHAETNDHDEPVRYVQMWVAPTHPRIEPSYRVDRLPRTERAAAGPLPGQPDARFFVVRPDEGGSVLPDALSLHVFVATGGVDIDGVGRLAEGDAVRFTDAGPRRISGRPGSLVGVWAMQG